MEFNLTKRLPAYPVPSSEQINIYFSYLSLKGKRRYAALMAGIEPSKLQAIIKKDDNLGLRQTEATEEYHERLELELHHRAVDGEQKAVYYKGKVVGYEVVKSDRLLETMLKAEIPEKYKNSMQVDGNITAGVLVINGTLDPDDWENEYGDMRIDASRLDRCGSEPVEAEKCD